MRREVPADGGPLVPRLEELCSGCDGTGVVASEEWEQWDRQNAQLQEQRAGAAGTAVLSALIEQKLAAHDQRRPAHPRQAPCEDCAGVGTVPTAEGAQLLAFLRRHLHTGK